MRIILVGGGTAGHINPALAIANYIRKISPESKILYVGAKGNMEEKLAKDENLEFKGITISGFSRKLNIDSIRKNFVTLKNIIISSFESRKILKDFSPDICLGTGGYVCGPFLREAYKLNIPFIIHDSNSFPGITTKLLAKKASKILLANKDAKKHLPSNINVYITGTPVRENIITTSKEEAKKHLNLDDNPTILSFGGSLGAKIINEVMAKIIIKSKEENNNFNFIHGYGKKCHSFEDTLNENNIYIKGNKKYIIKEYIKNMNECMAAADLVICRAGATTLSEIIAAKKPSILIPSPNVAENHQYYNALSLVNEKSASMIEEKNLTADKLYKEINKILKDEKRLNYPENLEKMDTKDSNKLVYDLIIETIKKSEGK